MKTLVVSGILIVICYYAFKSLYKTVTGKKGCGCSGSRASNCSMQKKCAR
ncbi:MAG: hypothetical protein ACRCZ2_07905 [Fusobacteriaceae bacterium]